MPLLNEINVKGTPHPIVTDDGYYQNMTVGDAEQLVGTVFEEDDTAFNYRTTGGSAEVGDRAYVDAIVGGSLPWNQLVPTSMRSYTNSTVDTRSTFQLSIQCIYPTSGNYTIRNAETMASTGIVAGVCSSLTEGAGFRIKHNGASADFVLAYDSTYPIRYGNKYLYSINVKGFDTSTVGGFDVDDVQLFDLTAMFGSTIADYIYGLETAHAGDGVAWFKRYFPKPYYAYHAVGMEHVNTVAAKTVGFNQWDEEWEVGALSSLDGSNYPSNTNIRSKNYIRLFPNVSYRITTPVGIYTFGYDENKNYIGRVPNSNAQKDVTFTVPSNVRYLRFFTLDAYGATYKNDICISIHWDNSRDGDYEPYNLHTYPLADLTLRGIPKKDESGNLYFDGDRYLPDGTVERRYGIVDLGTLSWSFVADPEWNCFIANVSDKKGGSKCICEKYPIGVIYNTANEKVMSGNDANGYIYIRDSSYTSASDFKTAMSGVMYVYELATPTTEEADPYQYPMVVDNWGTEAFVDGLVESGDRDVAIPVGHETKYPPNLKDKLESAANNPDADGAYILTHDGGSNVYTPLASNPTIQDIIARLEALEGGGENE